MKATRRARNWSTGFDDLNLIAADVILENPSRYGGSFSFPCVWARMLKARLEYQQQQNPREKKPNEHQ